MTDFLLELRSEEIPARMQDGARANLARLFTAELAKAGLQAGAITTYVTPRRLALIARDLPDVTQAVAEEVKGPKASAPPQALEGFLRKTGLTREQLTERDGVFFAIKQKPGRATVSVLAEAIPAIIRAFPWPKSMRWGDASISTESLRWVRPLHGIVALFGEELVPVVVAGATGSLAEPGNVIASGYATLGHRFHHPGPITLGGAHDYVEKLRACHVIVDQDERAALIRDGAHAAARAASLELIEDEGLVAENAGLTEWPVTLLGRFDPAFLDVPPEVIQLTARVNQKYFVCRTPLPLAGGVGGGHAADHASLASAVTPTPDPSRKREGGLANAFVCTANIAATDAGAAIVEGNRKVLAARLADARFFYEGDLKVSLEEQAKKLDRIVFHEKLGTVADKVDRVAKLARWLVEEGIVRSSPERGGEPSAQADGGGAVEPSGSPSSEAPAPRPAGELRVGSSPGRSSNARGAFDPPLPLPASGEDRAHLADLAERAARLCKADLVTGMVGEFPELQGVMGGYYAAAQGEDPQVAAAIRDHYKPVGQNEEVPTAPVTVAVSLADKLDTIVSFFLVDLKPTGSKDPFALRRAAIGAIEVILRAELRASLRQVIGAAMLPMLKPFEDVLSSFDKVENGIRFALARQRAVLDFFADRLKVQQREAGVRHDLIDAVFALGGEDDLVRLLARVRALQAFVGTEDGANLLIGYRRAANILKKEGYDAPLPLAGGVGGGQSADIHTHGPDLSDAPPPTPPASGRGENSLSYTPEPAEAALHHALDSAEPLAAQAVAAERFEGAMAALASLRAPIDAFFDTVTVNDPDAAKRAARLALLARVRDAVHTVADFSRIEG